MAWRAKQRAAQVDSSCFKMICSAQEGKHENDVITLLYHDGHLVSGGDDGKIKIWTQDLELVATIDAHPVNVYSLAVLDDTLYSCSNDGTFKAWNWGTWDAKKTILEKQQNDIIKVYVDNNILYASNDQGELFCFENEELTASYYLHEDIADLVIIGSLVFNARNVDVSVTEMMGANQTYQDFPAEVRNFYGPRFNYMSRGAMIGRFPIRRVGDYVCFLDRSARNVFVHNSTKEEKFKRVYNIKAHDMTISAMAACPGKEHIMLTGGFDRYLKAWDLTTAKNIGRLDTGICINDICGGEPGQIYISSNEGYLARIDCTFP
ncbi:hypothetical protein GE061_010894 [Apolygus lucorum]|uniref:WD repeat-containing protein 55 homolog n=1 Tax=Apolygus lucorum TaxID=248454 RepID=A0A6A4KA37_APOLU|nr:hypothetical protein GE061_010894 [Apolygus lucorum]